MLHCAIGLPATRKTATEEDRGEDNKDPDWLIEQKVHGGVTLRNAEKVINSLLAATTKLRDKLLSLYVALDNLWCSLRRNKISRQVA